MMDAVSHNAYQSDVFIDALPYVDKELEDENIKKEVERLIEKEMQGMKRVDRSSLPKKINLFQDNPVLAEDWKRVRKNGELKGIDVSRYEFKKPDDGQVESWKTAINNQKSLLESQMCSVINLELLQKYGANAWRVHNFQLEQDVKRIQIATENYKQQTRRINIERKEEQTSAAKGLRSLENKWTDMVLNNIRLEVECAMLEADVEEFENYSRQQEE